MEDIAELLGGCVKKFQVLVLSDKIKEHEEEVRQIQWQDELGRLRVWSANIGAHETGHLSLDYRLREASHITVQTIRVLKRLKRTLEDLQTMINGPDIAGEMSDSESDDECQGTETQLIYHALRDTITNLFQISLAIRRPSHHDRISGTKRIDAAGFEPFDIQHVSNKFPDSNPDLIKRLGLAISRRRAILCYRARHSKKVDQGLKPVSDDQSEMQSDKLSDTLANSVIQDSNIVTSMDLLSIGGDSSDAQSVLHSNEGISIPPMPAASTDGSPFKCPYCYRIISVSDDEKWGHHVLRDLMPYLCTFLTCATGQHLYESRREWYFHLQSQHSVEADSEDRIYCPLCPSSETTATKFEQHLGRHLEELALFALARPDLDTPVAFMNQGSGGSIPRSIDEVAGHGNLPRTVERLAPELKNRTIITEEGELREEVNSEETQMSDNEETDATDETESWISLNDGIGHELSYSFSQCRSWNQMRFYIRRDFPHIDDVGEYSLIDPNGRIISPHLWRSTIKPGWTIIIAAHPAAGKPKPSVFSGRMETSSLGSPEAKGGGMYICCRCHDGPKLYSVQPTCINCNHVACSSCVDVV